MNSSHTEGNFAPRAAEIAREAGSLLLSYFKRGVKTEYKGSGEVDLVTEADRAAEKLIVERLRSVFPDHDIVGEEGTRTRGAGKYRWYVDPLDGTTNFAHGYPVFCVSMGLEHIPGPDQPGELIAGVIYDPTREDLFTAERGHGARLNGRPTHVSLVPRLAESLVATGFPSKKRHENPNIYFYQEITLHSHGVRRAGSAALDLAYVACGRYDGYWEFNLNPWDTSAGVLLVEEAGGYVTEFNGDRFDPRNPREVLASNRLIHEELKEQFARIFSAQVDELPSIADYLKGRLSPHRR
jgi:myo-inositol-1(or 4)-monophosphatase